MIKTCIRCVMDSNVPGIIFDQKGACNYCSEFISSITDSEMQSEHTKNHFFRTLIDKIKKDGSGKPYDCIVGVSGGVDSAWVLYNAVKLGLRPLAVHLDNGWNSELAQNNIENLLQSLDLHLETYVIDWQEYRALMQAFFNADVVDVELLYDNAIASINYSVASRYGIKWILAGTNKSTEGMRMPAGWNWFKLDAKNIRNIAYRSGIKSHSSYPSIGVFGYLTNVYLRGIRWVSLLDLIGYTKAHAITTLQEECNFRPYPYKHYESVFTRFYQGYLLPTKFGIDKRRLHLSTLIASGQIDRDVAMELLSDSPYPSNIDLQSDKEFFLKKMSWQAGQLDEYISRPARGHREYGSELWLWELLLAAYGKLKKYSNITKKIRPVVP